MQNWSIEYELIDNNKNVYRRTASYRQERWARDAVDRTVLIFGVTRTVPATERKDLSRAVGGKFIGFGEETLPEDTARHVKKILGKDSDSYLLVDTVESGTDANRIYAARQPSGVNYSEFHFGAGEASVIRIVRDIEASADNSIILIEEIENGLHPVATRRLVEYLVEVAGRKSAQVIFTTHSNDALIPLPKEAVWSCAGGRLNQGKLDVAALRTLTGEVPASLAIFTEDPFSRLMVEISLRDYSQRNNVELLGIEVFDVGGEGNVCKYTEMHNKNPAHKFGAIGILDGDMASKADPKQHLAALPGGSDPEQHLVEKIDTILEKIAPRLAMNLQMRSSDQDRVVCAVRDVLATNRDPHLIFQQIGDQLDYLGGNVVASAFLTQWAQNFPDEVDQIFNSVHSALPKVQEIPQSTGNL